MEFCIDSRIIKKTEYKKINLVVYDDDNMGVVRKRSFDMLYRFNYVEDVVSFNFKIYDNPQIDDKTGCYNYLKAGKYDYSSKHPFDYSLIVNGYLERGIGFDAIANQLGLDENYIDLNIFSHYNALPQDSIISNKLLKNGKYIVLYFGPLKGNTSEMFNRGEYWKTKDWYLLCKALYKAWGLPLVIIGANYDLSYYHKFMNEIQDLEILPYIINLIGVTSLPETIAIIKNAHCLIGYTSGMPIVSTYLGTKTVMFWRPGNLSLFEDHHVGFNDGFTTNWVPKSMKDLGEYIPVWYSQDNAKSVFQKIIYSGWSPTSTCEKKSKEILDDPEFFI